MEKISQTLPVRVSQSDTHLVLVAPMPGINPADIMITIAGTWIKITGLQTGTRQDEKDMIMEEWAIGPYARELELPQMVSGRLTNATYGNGVLILAMPKANAEEDKSPVTFKLETIDNARGERIAHKGVDIHPTH